MSDSTPLTRGDLRRALDALRKPVSRYTCEWRNDTCGCIECRGDRALATLGEPTQCARYLCSQGQSARLDFCSTAIMGTHLPSEPCVRCARPLSAHQPAVPCVQSAFGGVTERPQPAPPCSEPDAKPAASAALPEIKAVAWRYINGNGSTFVSELDPRGNPFPPEHVTPLVPESTARAYADALEEAQRECANCGELVPPGCGGEFVGDAECALRQGTEPFPDYAAFEYALKACVEAMETHCKAWEPMLHIHELAPCAFCNALATAREVLK